MTRVRVRVRVRRMLLMFMIRVRVRPELIDHHLSLLSLDFGNGFVPSRVFGRIEHARRRRWVHLSLLRLSPGHIIRSSGSKTRCRVSGRERANPLRFVNMQQILLLLLLLYQVRSIAANRGSLLIPNRFAREPEPFANPSFGFVLNSFQAKKRWCSF